MAFQILESGPVRDYLLPGPRGWQDAAASQRGLGMCVLQPVCFFVGLAGPTDKPVSPCYCSLPHSHSQALISGWGHVHSGTCLFLFVPLHQFISKGSPCFFPLPTRRIH